MLRYVKQNIFESPAQVIVNTVNTVGVMGKGIAKEYKNLYPAMFKEYQRFCEIGALEVGKLWLYKTPNKWILNFPTKKHWRNPSKLEYLEVGLEKFVDTYEEKNIQSISFPQLGVGNGGLDWENEVKPLMEAYLKDLPIDIFIHIYTVSSKPEYENQKQMSEWLRNQPISLSFLEVKEDLLQILTRDKDNDLYINEEKNSVTLMTDQEEQEAIALVFFNHNRNSYSVIYFIEFYELWGMLRDNGFVSTKDLTEDQLSKYQEMYSILNLLPYVKLLEASSQQGTNTVDEMILMINPLNPDFIDKKEKVTLIS